jgi:pilus assembly protein CpaB
MKTSTRKLLLVLSGALTLTLALRLALSGGAKAPPPPPSVQVLIAARDLPAGQLLNASAWGWRSMAAADVPKGAIVQGSSDLAALKGALLHNAVGRGSPLRSSDIISSADPGFLAASLQPGMRAVSVAVNDVSGNAGLIQPGDHVDLILTQSLRDAQGAGRSVVSETIATNLRVIAVGASLQRPKDADANSGGQVRTVTLEVMPRGAAVVAVASKLGDISLALRSFATTGAADRASQVHMPAAVPQPGGDNDNGDGPVWAGDISRAARADSDRAAATAAAAAGSLNASTQNGVLILRGSTSNAAQATPATPLATLPIADPQPK